VETRQKIELWWTRVSSAKNSLDRMIHVLDSGERTRADRFRVPDARDRFVAAHIMLRIVIGRAVGLPPQRLQIGTRARGKPSLRNMNGSPGQFFNLSHSGDVAVVAVATSELGVDVEAHRHVANAERLAKRFFSESEQRWLSRQSRDKYEAAFFSIWTCKEAYLKAIGVGIAMPLRAIEIDPERPAIAAISNDPHTAAQWSMLRANLPLAAECAVAIRGQGWELDPRQFDWDDA